MTRKTIPIPNMPAFRRRRRSEKLKVLILPNYLALRN
jgi:hypothetical protein